MQHIILASGSPRRKELLTQMGVTFSVIPSRYNERLDDTRSSEDVAIELALGKAFDVAKAHPEALIIASDTIVTFNGRQLEKPKDSQEAYRTLTQLAGHKNSVTTSIALVCLAQNIQLSSSDTTDVYFKPRDNAAIEAYVATGDPLDKAGSYGIQSGAATLIDHIEGHYDTVIGLPTALLAAELRALKIPAQAVSLTPPVPVQ